MDFLFPLTVGLSVILITVGLHAVTTTQAIYLLKKCRKNRIQKINIQSRPLILGLTGVFLSVKHYLDIILWALAYWIFAGAEHFANFEDAVYFSSVTYTTLGYGDVTLSDNWRLLCGIQAMNGVLLFGWSTAILFYLVQRFWSEQQMQAEVGEP
ncbi:MAG: potassium channel family protein [Pirellulales bacterium]|jgi:voltage-gated potassium channel